jgi:type I restriction enzyme M protein
LSVPIADIKATIQQYPQFAAFVAASAKHFHAWRDTQESALKNLQPAFAPKDLITHLSESLLAHYRGRPLTDAYAIYQHLMDYWAETMQDDAWLIAADGWKAEPHRITEEKKNKQGEVTRTIDKGWACGLVPKPLVVARYFAQEQAELDALAAKLEATEAVLTELEEEHSGEGGAFNGFDKINAKTIKERLDEIGDLSPSSFPRRRDCGGRMPERTSAQPMARRASVRDGASISSDSDNNADEIAVLKTWQKLDKQRAALKKRIKEADGALDDKALARYADLTEADIKTLVVDDKWLAALARATNTETERTGQQLTGRVRELAERYAAPLPQLEARVAELQAKVDAHLQRMGCAWT